MPTAAPAFVEHNLYPLRYNKAVGDIGENRHRLQHHLGAQGVGEDSQRYPIHWGGDAESTDDGMAGRELRGGLSFQSCRDFPSGATTSAASRRIRWRACMRFPFARWLAFGMLSSHSRCHGEAPKEPWRYGTNFMDKFRIIDGLKYRLMPYVYVQAKDCSEHGLPMIRALFIEYPNDPGSWLVDNEYLFGSSILVSPLMHEGATGRAVYLPPGTWIDYQTGKSYAGGWQQIEAGKIPEVILVRDGTVVPQIWLAQCTKDMD